MFIRKNPQFRHMEPKARHSDATYTRNPKFTTVLFIQAKRGQANNMPSHTRTRKEKMVARDNGTVHNQKRRI